MPGLSEVGQRHVWALIHKYQSVFSAWERDLGCTKLISLDIPLVDEAPVRQHLRRIPQSEYENLKAQINQLLEAKIACESYGQYASLIV